MSGSPVAGLVRRWVRLYTRGLPPELRAARRDEIEDDLWCEQDEAAAAGRTARSLDTDLAVRLLFGIPSDLSWRLSYRGAPEQAILEKRASIGTRILGLFAIVAAASVLTLPILTGGTSEPGWAWVWIPIGSMIAFTAAALGLALQFVDRIGRLGAFGALLVPLGAAMIAGAYVLGLAVIPVGSAMLTWDLARTGVLSRRAAIAHLAAAAILLTGLAVVLLSPTSFAVVLVGAVSYLLSWISIGVTLIRGVPAAGHAPGS